MQLGATPAAGVQAMLPLSLREGQMSRVSLRFRHLLIASLSVFSAGAFSAAAAAQDPAAPSPIPMPYPNDSSKVVAHKHIAGVKYEDFAKGSAVETATAELSDSPDTPGQPLEIIGLSWGKIEGAGTVYSADPMEGGQIARKQTRPAIGEMNVTKLSDKSSANLAERKYAPGKPTYGNLVEDAPVMVAEPVAKGTASFKTLAGLCAAGKHLDKVKITTRSRGFTLHDATVISVTPADSVDGRAMEQVTLSYASLGD